MKEWFTLGLFCLALVLFYGWVITNDLVVTWEGIFSNEEMVRRYGLSEEYPAWLDKTLSAKEKEELAEMEVYSTGDVTELFAFADCGLSRPASKPGACKTSSTARRRSISREDE